MKILLKTIITGVLAFSILLVALSACNTENTSNPTGIFTGLPDVVEVNYFYESDACFCLKGLHTDPNIVKACGAIIGKNTKPSEMARLAADCR